MTDAKHTPEPWAREGLTIYALNAYGVNRFRAQVEPGFVVFRNRGEPVRTSLSETVANARLIAAAPDMHEALERAEQLISGDLVGAEWKRACHEFVRQARAALAKARGEAT